MANAGSRLIVPNEYGFSVVTREQQETVEQNDHVVSFARWTCAVDELDDALTRLRINRRHEKL